jgi:hypothetical protein
MGHHIKWSVEELQEQGRLYRKRSSEEVEVGKKPNRWEMKRGIRDNKKKGGIGCKTTIIRMLPAASK